MLKIEHLTKKFGPFTAVNDVTLSIESGSFIGLIGRSGAGKFFIKIGILQICREEICANGAALVQ